MTDQTPQFVGIDVSKDRLDIAVRPLGTYWQCPNAAQQFPDLVARLRALAPRLIVLEASGGLQVPVSAALAEAGLPLAVVNPRQVRDFAKATGTLAKTDALDARVLAHFAEAVRPEAHPLPSAQTLQLDALMTRRRQLVAMHSAEHNRLASAPACVHPDIEAHLRWLAQRIDNTDKELRTLIENSPVWRVKDALLQSMCGIGPVSATTLLDLALPGLDGYQVARRLRRLPGTAATRIIAVTGYAREEDRRRSLKAGIDRHLVKPVSLAELEAAIGE